MLQLEDLLEKMKKHFPRWMDIRRKNNSIGQQYLLSVANELSNIQKAIDDYKKDFFIDNYLNKSEEIIDFIYKANVGYINKENIFLITPSLSITENENEFYLNDSYAYYNDGILYFRQPYKTIKYSLNGYLSSCTTEKQHVWNIYDEFAVFTGLRRFENETNKELLNRILNINKNKVNSSQDGLKNAIITNLINIDPNLTKQDITIERPTPKNLVKYYDEFETILDHLIDINKDIYRTKRWDLDTWNFKFKSIDYIPHAWDVLLTAYVNGVGFKDDLEVKMIDNNSKTNLSIMFYQKSIEKLNEYMRTNNISKPVKLKLKKYKTSLIPENIKYKITASEFVKFSPNNIFIKRYNNVVGSFKEGISDLIENKDSLHNVDTIDNTKLPEGKYSLNFKSLESYNEFNINECFKINSKGQIVNLITKDKIPTGFEQYKNGMKSTCKKCFNEIHQFETNDNCISGFGGIGINNITKAGTLKVNINGLQNNKIHYDYSIKEIPFLDKNIIKSNIYLSNNNKYMSDDTDADKYLLIDDFTMNSFSCNIHGPYKIIYSKKNQNDIILEDKNNIDYTFKINKTDIPEDYSIKIYLNPKKNEKGYITNINYSKYLFNLETENGVITNGILPDFNKNTLILKMNSLSTTSPILKYIYIGERIDKLSFDLDITINKDERLFIDTKDNIDITLTMKNNEDKIIKTVEHFKTCINYVGKSDDSFVIINLKDFKSISSIGYSNISVLDNNRYVIKIPKNCILSQITILGEKQKINDVILFSNLLKRIGYDELSYEFAASKNSNGIIAQNIQTKKIDIITIKNDKIFDNEKISKIEFLFPNKDLSCAFVLNNDNTIVTNIHDKSFTYMYLLANKSSLYTTINEMNMISPYLDNIRIVNTFNNNFLIDNPYKFFFTIESLNKDYDIKFQNDSKNFNMYLNYSICDSKIAIKRNNLNQNMNYNFTIVYTEKETTLSNVIDLNQLMNKDINLNEYIILPDNNFEIIYKTKFDDLLNKDAYVFTEYIDPNDNLFNKLKYSNINEVEKFVIVSQEGEIDLKENVDYLISKEKGIILFNQYFKLKEDEKIFIRYNIKKANALKFSIDYLYEQIPYNINSLKITKRIELENIEDNKQIDLSIYKEFKNADIVDIKCSNIAFTGNLKNNILNIKKIIPTNTIAIKSGYYYFDGKEFYLYAHKNQENINKINNVIMFEVEQKNKTLLLKQKTKNFLPNSKMIKHNKNLIYNLNCTNEDNCYNGISVLNALTACNNFNYWQSYNCDIQISKGLNGLGIKLNSFNKNLISYAYLDLNSFIKDNIKYNLSFYVDKNIEAFIGIEEDSVLDFNKRSIIKIDKEIHQSTAIKNIYETTFFKIQNKKYYLIIKGNDVVIDDIILQDSKYYNIDHHKKNIDHLNLNIAENIFINYQTRLFLNDYIGCKCNKTEIKNDYLINSSDINWGYTKTHSIDMKKCVLENIDLIKYNNENILQTDKEPGYMTSYPIYIGNSKLIKNLCIKINDVMFSDMTNFSTTISTSNSMLNTNYEIINTFNSNIVFLEGNSLQSYIKINLNLPQKKNINNIDIYTEYKSNEKNSVIVKNTNLGYYLSKIMDAQYTERFILNKLKFSDLNTNINNVKFEIRASKENDKNMIWTDFKEIQVDDNGNILNRIVFDKYRYFQLKVSLSGVNSKIKLKHLDLEVI